MKRSREPEQDLDPDSPAGASHESSPHPAKISELGTADDSDDDESGNQSINMKCSLPPHKEPIVFQSYAEYESHYHSFHTNRCLECHKNFPSEHLLGVHIEECHDPLVRIKREKGDHTYSCFVEGCERKCLTHQKRRMHMIDKHMYPKNFFFAITKDGVDGRRSLLVDGGHGRRRSSVSHTKEHRRRASTLESSDPKATTVPEPASPKANQSEKKPADVEMESLTGAMSAMQFVPPSVRFGRGRAGFSKS